MRGVGPHVLISFPAQEGEKARQLGEDLGSRGCRITLESEGEAPGDQSMGLDDKEVFVQLRTKDSLTAVPLDGRLKQALERQERDTTFVLVPVALEGTASGDAFGDWVYIDASPSGLGWQSSVDLVARTALSAVHALPLSKTTPLEFDSDALTLMIKQVPGDQRRIVIDSDDIILTGARRTVAQAQAFDGPTGEAASRQQTNFVRSVERQLVVLDAVLFKLVAELYAQHAGYSLYNLEYGAGAARSIGRFSRLALWQAVKILSEWPACIDAQWREPFGATTERVQDFIRTHSPGDEMHGLSSWSLGPRVVDGCDDFVEVEAAAPGKATMRWYLPRTIFGRDWQSILQFGSRPSAEIPQGDWLEFVLPQIAFRAWRTGEAMTDRLATGFAWKPEEYDTIGLP
jgi:hypothetical protein